MSELEIELDLESSSDATPPLIESSKKRTKRKRTDERTTTDVEKLLRNKDVQLKPNPKGTAKFWETFSRVHQKDAFGGSAMDFVACNLCEKVYVYVPGATGSNQFDYHSKNCSPKATQKNTNDNYVSAKVSARTKSAITSAAALWCAKDSRSFNIVEGDEFRQFVAAVIQEQLNYTKRIDVADLLPSGASVSNYVELEAKAIRSQIAEVIKKSLMDAGGCFTTDFWSEDYTKASFGSLTFHYIENGKLQQRLLCCSEYDATLKKSAENVRKFIVSELANFCISETDVRNAVFVTDGGMAAPFRIRPTLERINCAAHMLNLVLVNSFNENPGSNYKIPDAALPIKKLIEDCKALVKHCRQASISRQLSRKLINSVATRWNSNLEMMESILKEYEIVEGLLCERDEVELLPEKRIVLEDLVELYDVFRKATNALSSSKSPTLHLVALWFTKVKRHLASFTSKSGDPNLKAYVEHLGFVAREKLKIDDLHGVAAFLYPLSKNLDLEFFVGQREHIMSQVRSRMDRFQHLNLPATASPSTSQVLEDDLDDLLTYSNRTAEQDEVSEYMSLPAATKQEAFNVLEYWEHHRQRFPKLYLLAQSVFAVQATSCASERLFSQAGNMVTDRRTSLNSGKLDDLLFLKWNKDL